MSLQTIAILLIAFACFRAKADGFNYACNSLPRSVYLNDIESNYVSEIRSQLNGIEKGNQSHFSLNDFNEAVVFPCPLISISGQEMSAIIAKAYFEVLRSSGSDLTSVKGSGLIQFLLGETGKYGSASGLQYLMLLAQLEKRGITPTEQLRILQQMTPIQLKQALLIYTNIASDFEETENQTVYVNLLLSAFNTVDDFLSYLLSTSESWPSFSISNYPDNFLRKMLHSISRLDENTLNSGRACRIISVLQEIHLGQNAEGETRQSYFQIVSALEHTLRKTSAFDEAPCSVEEKTQDTVKNLREAYWAERSKATLENSSKGNKTLPEKAGSIAIRSTSQGSCSFSEITADLKYLLIRLNTTTDNFFGLRDLRGCQYSFRIENIKQKDITLRFDVAIYSPQFVVSARGQAASKNVLFDAIGASIRSLKISN